MSITEEVKFASKYLLGARIGRGAMGNVYEAQVDDGSLDRVAIKILKSELTSEEKTVARFIQEGEIFRLIDHENVIEVLDVVAEDEQLAIVMELVPDGDLRQMMKRGTITPSLAVKIAADVAAGLEATHEANVVHRDLKPPNILMADTDDGWVAKISDFGISRLLDDATTRSSTTIGTPLYMAPESVGKGGPESPADIYGLGIIIFELLIGHAPFNEGGTLGVIRAHADDLPPVLHGVPDELSQLVNQMLEKEPEVRPDAAEVHSRLMELLPLMDDGEVPYELPAIDESLFQPVELIEDDDGDDDDDDDKIGILGGREKPVGIVGDRTFAFVDGIAARVMIFVDRLPFSNLNVVAGAVFTVVLLALAGISIFGTSANETTVASSETITPEFDTTLATANSSGSESATTSLAEDDPRLPTFGQGQAPGSVIPAEPSADEPGVNSDLGSQQPEPRAPAATSPPATRRSPTTSEPVRATPVTGVDRSPTTSARPATTAQPATSRLVTSSPVTTSRRTTQPQTTVREVSTTRRTTTTRPTTTTRRTTTTRLTTSSARPVTTVATTVAPTTAAPTTQAAGAAIRIVSGPSVVSRGATSIVFGYTTNQVCGSGSFTFTNNTTGASAGGHTGHSSCFGPYHEGRSTWGTVNLEPGTTYTVRLTVRGQRTNGSLPTGTGSASRTFQVSTTG